MEAISSVFWGVVTLSILVFIHEAGHYLAARLFGLRVHEFMIGLPGPKVAVTIGETRYGITAVPLGGYVKIAGMAGDPNDPLLEPVLGALASAGAMPVEELLARFPDNAEGVEMALFTLEDWGAVRVDRAEGSPDTVHPVLDSALAESHGSLIQAAKNRTYQGLATGKRLVVLLSGVAVNIVAALIIFTAVLSSMGVLHDTGTVEPLADGPSATAGLMSGDRIVSVGGASVEGFVEVVDAIGRFTPGDDLVLEVERGTERLQISVLLAKHPDNGGAFAGIRPQTENRPIPLGQAATTSFVLLGATAQALLGFFNPATAASSLENSASIVGISVFAAEAASSGLMDYLMLMASISLSLGLINLLPIPPLDGGRVVIEIAQRIIGRPLSPVLTGVVTFAGMFLLIGLMVFLLVNDVSNLVSG